MSVPEGQEPAVYSTRIMLGARWGCIFLLGTWAVNVPCALCRGKEREHRAVRV